VPWLLYGDQRQEMKIGDFVFPIDGKDMRGKDTPGPRMRVVLEVLKDGCVCGTVEGGIGLLFRTDELHPASEKEIAAYQPVELLGFDLEN